jgi:HYDIN/CFA65/VesB-like, Ig-like domain
VTFACLASQAMHGGKAAASALRVEAVAPGIAIFPASLDLGSQTVGTTSIPRTVSVTNVGADPLAIGAVTAAGDFASVTNCGAVLPAGATCGISVQMTPTAVGTRAGSLTIADNAAGTPHNVTLSGVGVAVPTGGGATPVGAYTVTVSGTVSALTHATGVILTVQ